MLNLLKRPLFTAALLAVLPSCSFSAPANSSRLLPLIPAEAGVVAGVVDPHSPNTNGHHLLVTVSNSFDLDDCLSVTGVDSSRAVDQLIWMAASSPRGSLKEHAILAAGRFDRDHIFRAAKQNGASSTFYSGVEALIVAPLPREENQMQDVRWLAIFDSQTAVFGTPWLVQRAIDRYVLHASTDPLLESRIGHFRADVNSWNVLALPADPAARSAALSQLHSPWTDLLANASALTLGTRYGSTAHIDFDIELPQNQTAASAQASAPPPRVVPAAWLEGAQTRMENLTAEPGRIQGSLAMPRKQFDSCFQLHPAEIPLALAMNSK